MTIYRITAFVLAWAIVASLGWAACCSGARTTSLSVKGWGVEFEMAIDRKLDQLGGTLPEPTPPTPAEGKE